jgi:gliding motility-associated-like protein
MTFLNEQPYRFFLLLSMMFLTTLGFAQENCTNGIDDDGNGLIDSQDPACFACYDISYSLIEEDFEDYNCCPDNLSQTFCINGWESISGSPDFVNTCDFLGGGSLIPFVPEPIPSGEGAVGIAAWNESMGTCLDDILLAGQSYDISFHVGFNTAATLGSNLIVEFTLWGAYDCSVIEPLALNPCSNLDWFELATFAVTGVENDSWIYFSSSFVPSLPASAIAIGHSCEFIALNGPLQYHFLDDIVISGNTGTLVDEIPEVSFSGNCLDGVFVESNITNGVAYQWYFDDEIIPGATSNPYQIDATETGLYQVSVLGNSGCTLFSAPLSIVVDLDVLDIEAIVTNVSCVTEPNGIIELSVVSPNLPYEFLWSDGSTDQINDNLEIGTYTVTVTDNNGCFSSETYTIIGPEKIDAIVSGDCIDGVFISVDEISGATYQWYLDGALIADATQNPYEIPSDYPGLYHVIVSNGVDCNESNPLVVDIEIEVLEIGGEVVDLLCYLVPTGSIDVVDNDMNPPLTYNWSNGEDTQEIENLEAGIYFVTVTDANGCFGVMDFTVESPDPFINTLTVVQPDMGNPGAAGIISNGGVMPYNYAWSNGFNMSFDNNLASGSYMITVTDGNGCQEIFEFEIISNYIVVAMVTNESCPDACDGSVLLTIDGENSDYSIFWDDNSISGFNPTQLCAGTYSYTVTDSEDSPFIGTAIISTPSDIIISSIFEDTLCANGGVTDITLSIIGGNPSYAYLWNTGSIQDTLFDVGSGSYSVEVMDLSGCSVTDTFIIDSLPLIELQFETTPTGCDGEEIGAIDLTINNGIEPFDILWSNDSISEDLISLGSGWYFVTITDSIGCMANDSVRVDANSGIEVMADVDSINCKGDDNGLIFLDISGGEMPYDITWSNDEKTETIEKLSPGNYAVTIVDAAGCTWSENYNVLLNSDIIISTNVVSNDCFGGEAGSIELTIENANTSYTVLWGDGSSEENRYNLMAGDYSFSLVDSFGCGYVDNFTISEGVKITYQTIISEPGCNGATDGLISISPVTGEFPLSYQWSNGGTINQINDLSSGTYFLTITDDNDCVKLDTFVLSESSDVEVTETIDHNSCYLDSDGSISLDISGGSQPYDILWSNAETSMDVESLPAGDYFVTIVDANDCTSSYLYSIFEPDSLHIEDFVVLPFCHDDIGQIGAQGNGGTQLYTFLWSTGETSPGISIAPGNTYTVTMTDMNLCTKEKTYVIDDILEIEIVTTSIIDPSALNNDGSITIDVSGGTSPYEISWDNGGTGLNINNLGVGTYTATVIDANDCTQSITIVLSNDPISVAGIATGNLCFGDCLGQIDLTIEGGSEPFTITWSDGQNGPNAVSLCNGEYQATIIDGLGEEIISELFYITGPSIIIIDGQAYDISCIDMDDGSIIINSDGGEEPFDYNWSNTMSGDSIGNLSPGEYSVTVMDNNGCSESGTYNIEDIPIIEIDIEALPFDCENPLGTIIFNGDNNYDYPYLLNGNLVIPNEDNEITDLEPGIYQLSYAINETCVVNIETVTIKEKQENDFELSNLEFTVFEEEEVGLTIKLSEDPLLSNFMVDWTIINSYECILLNEFGQCIEVLIFAQESEIVEITITDEDGCETILEAKINVEERETEIYLPNIFSPNDDGINDEFTIHTNDEDLFIESMLIFDRWGNIVYSQKNTDLQNFISWNGEMNGKKVAPNVFVYRIEVVNGKGEAKVLFGDLAVVY